jgi:hypothetical protein
MRRAYKKTMITPSARSHSVEIIPVREQACINVVSEAVIDSAIKKSLVFCGNFPCHFFLLLKAIEIVWF